METGFAGDFRVVQQLRIQFNLAVVGAAAEEVDNPAATQRPGGRFPHLRHPHGFDGDISATPARELANLFHGLSRLA